MWIIAGPNGAGKSTFTNDLLLNSTVTLIKLNADERTLALRQQNPTAPLRDLNLRAAQETDAAVEACIDRGESFLVETVLSSPKYRDDVFKAKANGYTFGLVYVSLHPPELSPQRVSTRVKKGGHDVDPKIAIERHARSHIQLRWFAARAEVLAVYDNSTNDATPRLIASRSQGQRLKVPGRGINPSVDKALRLVRGKHPVKPTP